MSFAPKILGFRSHTCHVSGCVSLGRSILFHETHFPHLKKIHEPELPLQVTVKVAWNVHENHFYNPKSTILLTSQLPMEGWFSVPLSPSWTFHSSQEFVSGGAQLFLTTFPSKHFRSCFTPWAGSSTFHFHRPGPHSQGFLPTIWQEVYLYRCS